MGHRDLHGGHVRLLPPHFLLQEPSHRNLLSYSLLMCLGLCAVRVGVPCSVQAVCPAMGKGRERALGSVGIIDVHFRGRRRAARIVQVGITICCFCLAQLECFWSLVIMQLSEDEEKALIIALEEAFVAWRGEQKRGYQAAPAWYQPLSCLVQAGIPMVSCHASSLKKAKTCTCPLAANHGQ